MKERLVVLLIATGSLAVANDSPFDVGSRSQLFVDQVLVRSFENVAFTLHPGKKHPQNPLVKADQPWEGWSLGYSSVLYDEDEHLFKMWYNGEALDYFPKYAALYATSKDGIVWEKPLVGTIRCPKVEKHNAVVENCFPHVIKDAADPDPAKRYKAIICREGLNGYHTMVSPDGWHWTQFSREPIAPGWDVMTGYYDRRLGLYVAFPKTHDAQIAGLPNPRRVFSVITSKDFVNWTKPELAFVPDLRDDAGSLARIEEVRAILDVPDAPHLMRTEFYGIGAYPQESCTLAFPWVFTVNNNGRFGNQEGPSEVQLAVSRDLKHWERPFRVPCIPRGRIGEWDCGFFSTASEAIRVGDEVWLYYGGANYTHGTPCLFQAEGTGRHTKFTSSIGLAVWQRDRFVSVDAPPEGGTLTTVPIVFSGSRLELNAATGKKGSVTVELLDATGKTLAKSKPFTGDDLRHRVIWDREIDIGRLAGKPVTLKFHLNRAELYAFAFRAEP